MPLDAYEQPLRDGLTVERAKDALAAACVKRFGLNWSPAPVADAEVIVDKPHYRLFGLLDDRHANAYGYHPGQISEGGKSSPAPELTRDLANVLGAKYGGGQLNGIEIPEDGCYGEADRKLSEGAAVYDPTYVESVATEAWRRSNADNRVQAGFQRWSKCMKSKGFNYHDPMQANNDPEWQTDKPTDREIATATADVACKKAVNLTGIRMAVDAGYQRLFIEAEFETLNAIKEGLSLRLAKAQAVLSQQEAG